METLDMVAAERPRAAVLLPEALDMRAAAPLAAEFLERRGRDVEVDASKVRRLGAQCLQVLLAAHACWKADRSGFRVVSPSNDFTEGLALLGAPAFEPLTGA